MSDLAAAKAAFLDAVQTLAPDRVGRFAVVLDDLVAWSEQFHPRLQFVWHAGGRGSQRQHLVKYCVPGVPSPFWAAWPKGADGAKLSVLTDRGKEFPEHLREEARVELAAIDGREPKAGESPEVAFAQLIWPANRERVKALLARLLGQLEAGR